MKQTSLTSIKLDVVVLGARIEEKDALVKEFRAHRNKSATEELENRMKAGRSMLPCFVLNNAGRPEGTQISVGILECADMGNVAAAVNSAYAMIRYEPSLIMFSGIAGSLDAKKVRIGDVILPRKIKSRYFNKLKSSSNALDGIEAVEYLTAVSGALSPVERDAAVTDTAGRLLSLVEPEALNSELQDIAIPDTWVANHGLLARRATYIREETAFSWGKVLSNASYIERIKGILGNSCTTVDMESFGFLRAVHRLRDESFGLGGYSSHPIVVRAVSDYAQFKDLSDANPIWRSLGLQNMAIATRYIVQNLYCKVFD